MYKIYLSACGNPDFGEDPEKNIVRGKVIEDKVLEFDSMMNVGLLQDALLKKMPLVLQIILVERFMKVMNM